MVSLSTKNYEDTSGGGSCNIFSLEPMQEGTSCKSIKGSKARRLMMNLGIRGLDATSSHLLTNRVNQRGHRGIKEADCSRNSKIQKIIKK
jgi:hypothetical protein